MQNVNSTPEMMADSQAGRQAGGQADRQTDRLTGRQTCSIIIAVTFKCNMTVTATLCGSQIAVGGESRKRIISILLNSMLYIAPPFTCHS